jgi:3-oxoacid CoA-transferase B subunit
MTNSREVIAKNIAFMLNDNDVVNLGIGIPIAVPDYLPADINVIIHGENGIAGLGPAPLEGQGHPDIVDASANPATLIEGASCFDSAQSFMIARGGHLDVTVLGGMEVDEQGNLANWMIPGKMMVGMGGAMDLVAGAKKVIIALEHTSKNGSPKIVKNCSLPLTGVGVVDVIVTEHCIIEVTKEGLKLKAIAPGITVEEVQSKTEPTLIIPEIIAMMN